MGVFQEKFGLVDFPEEQIERIIGCRMNPYGITEPYPDFAEIAERENLTPEEVRRILTTTTIVWGH